MENFHWSKRCVNIWGVHFSDFASEFKLGKQKKKKMSGESYLEIDTANFEVPLIGSIPKKRLYQYQEQVKL